MFSKLDELVNSLSLKQDINVSVGLRPSGTIHLGNIMALTIAAILSYQRKEGTTNLLVDICDLELPNTNERTNNEFTVRHFKYLDDKDGCHESIAKHNAERIFQYLDELASKLGMLRITKTFLSDVQREEGYRLGLKRIAEKGIDMTKYIAGIPDHPEFNDKRGVYLFPICPECNSASTHLSIYEKGKIYTKCENKKCDVDEYETDIMDPEREIAVHFFIDPIRDVTVKPYADVHIFGGDYNKKHKSGEDRQVEKIRNIMIAAGGNAPLLFTGPKIYAADGTLMSKSKANGLDIIRLREQLGEQYITAIVEFTKEVLDRGINKVKFDYIQERLLYETITAGQNQI